MEEEASHHGQLSLAFNTCREEVMRGERERERWREGGGEREREREVERRC